MSNPTFEQFVKSNPGVYKTRQDAQTAYNKRYGQQQGAKQPTFFDWLKQNAGKYRTREEAQKAYNKLYGKKETEAERIAREKAEAQARAEAERRAEALRVAAAKQAKATKEKEYTSKGKAAQPVARRAAVKTSSKSRTALMKTPAFKKAFFKAKRDKKKKFVFEGKTYSAA